VQIALTTEKLTKWCRCPTTSHCWVTTTGNICPDRRQSWGRNHNHQQAFDHWSRNHNHQQAFDQWSRNHNHQQAFDQWWRQEAGWREMRFERWAQSASLRLQQILPLCPWQSLRKELPRRTKLQSKSQSLRLALELRLSIKFTDDPNPYSNTDMI